MPETRIFKDKEALAQAFAAFMAKEIAERPIYHIALSGGSTPKALYRELAEEWSDRIPWDRVRFHWGDERCVPPDDSESNFGSAHSLLLSRLDIPEGQVFRMKGEEDPEREAERYAQQLEDTLPMQGGRPVFDLIILGLGDDGHTASIFPREMDLWDADSHCVVASHPDTGQRRISLTGGVINRARAVAFLVTGDNKAETVSDIHHRKIGFSDYPASRVFPASGRLLWFLDEEAGYYLIPGRG